MDEQMNVSFETTILGGLPVYVQGNVAPPEPDVGIFHYYVYDYEIFWASGKKLRNIPNSMYERMTEDEIDDLKEEILTWEP